MSNAAIFQIENTVTGDKYIGATRKPDHVWPAYQSLLNRPGSRGISKRLQELWDSRSHEEFKFKLLEECSKRDLPRRKKSWLAKEKPSLNVNSVRNLDTDERGARITTERRRPSWGDEDGGGKNDLILNLISQVFDTETDVEVTLKYGDKTLKFTAA